MSFFDKKPGCKVALADLLEIENSTSLLEPCCPDTGIPVWPLVRVAFLRLIMADLLFGSGVMEPPMQPRSLRAISVLGRSALHNLISRRGFGMHGEVVVSTNTIRDERREGRWYNRYADPLIDAAPGSAVALTDIYDWRWNMPRHHDRILYHTPIQVAAALKGRFASRRIRMIAEAVVAMASERAHALLGWEIGSTRRAAFTTWAAAKLAAVPLRYGAYQRLLHRARPRLLLSLAACYGPQAPLIAAARDLDIVTAEFQHGSISSGHDAYNFAPSVIRSEAYRRTLPQYLLTYGAWWSAQISAPVERIEIGYPARAEKLAGVHAATEERRTVLILSDGIEFDLYLDLARTVASAVAGAGLGVALRPHPLERRVVLERYGGRIDDILIDAAPDIYTSFASAHTVISELSTGLFEAVGVVDRIVLLDTAKARFAYPTHPFAAATSIAQVIEWLSGSFPATPAIEEHELWAPEWRRNYEWFLANKVGIGR